MNISMYEIVYAHMYATHIPSYEKSFSIITSKFLSLSTRIELIRYGSKIQLVIEHNIGTPVLVLLVAGRCTICWLIQ